MNDEWWIMYNEWWMMNDEWWIINHEWSMMNDQWWMNKGGWGWRRVGRVQGETKRLFCSKNRIRQTSGFNWYRGINLKMNVLGFKGSVCKTEKKCDEL